MRSSRAAHVGAYCPPADSAGYFLSQNTLAARGRLVAVRKRRDKTGGLPVIPVEAVAARTHARLAAELARSRVALAPHDLLIAATAVSIGYRLATRDRRGFALIPELRTLAW